MYIAENDLRQKQFALHFTAHSIALCIFYIFYILCIWKWLLRLCAGGCELSECMCYCLWSTSFLLRCLFPLAYGKCVLCIRFSRFFFSIVYRLPTHTRCSLRNSHYHHHTVWKCSVYGCAWVNFDRDKNWKNDKRKTTNTIIVTLCEHSINSTSISNLNRSQFISATMSLCVCVRSGLNAAVVLSSILLFTHNCIQLWHSHKHSVCVQLSAQILVDYLFSMKTL